MEELILERNRQYKVFWTERSSYLFKCSFEDNYHHLEVEVEVTFPDWIIVNATGKWVRWPHEICLQALDILGKLKGLYVGKGFRQKLTELAVGPHGCTQVFDIVLETSILTLFVGNRARLDKIEKQPESPDEQVERLARERPWIIDSCLAMKRSRFNLGRDGE